MGKINETKNEFGHRFGRNSNGQNHYIYITRPIGPRECGWRIPRVHLISVNEYIAGVGLIFHMGVKHPAYIAQYRFVRSKYFI